MGGDQQAEGASTFTLFSKLPRELQIRIWNLITRTYNPRNVRVRLALSDFHPIRCLTSVPPILHVCRDSRGAAQKVYKECFGVQLHTDGQEQKAVYLNPETDSLFITFTSFSQYAIRHGWRKMSGEDTSGHLPSVVRRSASDKDLFGRNGATTVLLVDVWSNRHQGLMLVIRKNVPEGLSNKAFLEGAGYAVGSKTPDGNTIKEVTVLGCRDLVRWVGSWNQFAKVAGWTTWKR